MAEPAALPEDELVERVRVVTGGVVLLRQVPDLEHAALDQLFSRAERLLAPLRPRKMVFDLTEAGVPDAATRLHIREWLERLDCADMGFVFGTSALLRVAARFVLASLRRPNVRVFARVDEAIEELSRDR